MMELRADAALVLDARRPRNDDRVACAAEMRSDLLSPLERGVHCPGLAHGEMVIGIRAADFVDVFNYVRGILRHAVQTRHLVEHTIEGAFHRGAVVADFPDDKGIVELSG